MSTSEAIATIENEISLISDELNELHATINSTEFGTYRDLLLESYINKYDDKVRLEETLSKYKEVLEDGQ